MSSSLKKSWKWIIHFYFYLISLKFLFVITISVKYINLKSYRNWLVNVETLQWTFLRVILLYSLRYLWNSVYTMAFENGYDLKLWYINIPSTPDAITTLYRGRLFLSTVVVRDVFECGKEFRAPPWFFHIHLQSVEVIRLLSQRLQCLIRGLMAALLCTGWS